MRLPPVPFRSPYLNFSDIIHIFSHLPSLFPEKITKGLDRAASVCYCAHMDALWQILRVKSGTEKQLALSLGAKAYVPQRPKVRYNRRHRRIVYSQEPVLSGLVFVRCADTQSVDLFLPGILGWVRKSDRGVLTLGQNDIDYMKQMEKTVWAGKSSLYDRGDRVVLKSTQFAGRDAIVIEVKKNRAVVSLIGMEIPLNVDVGALQAA